MKIKILTMLVLLLALPGWATWMQQSITLKSGSNLVHLKVNPAETLCSEVFGANSSITEVSWWNRNRRDDGSGIAPSTDMLVWKPDDEAASTFHRVLGGYCYVIKCKAATTLTIIGTPARARPTLWLGELNLVGVHVPAGATLNYFDYFNGYLDHVASGQIWADMPTEQTLPIASNTRISSPNTAIWVLPSGSGTGSYMGVLDVTTDSADEILDFSTSSYARTIRVKNVGTQARVLRFDLEQSLAPPAGQGTKAGGIALMKEEIDWSVGYAHRVYVPMSFPLVTNIASGATFELTVRPNLTTLVDTNAGDYLGIIRVNDAGSVVAGSVMSKGTCEHRIGVKVGGHLAAPRHASAGLWVGSAVITNVSRQAQFASSTNENVAPDGEEANQPFSFRLLVHVDGSGHARLLKEAYIASRVEAEAEPVLLVSRAAALNYRRNNPNAKIRRVSSANFPNYGRPIAFTNAVAGTMTGFAQGGTLTASVVQTYDDKVNPFVHAYHPQHDNVHFDNKAMKKFRASDEVEGTGTFESWPIIRNVTLVFKNEDPNGSNYDWNTTVSGGDYQEEFVAGSLTKTPVTVKGTFRLTRVVETAILSEM